MSGSKKNESIVYLDKKGKRLDGRTAGELRPIKIEVGVVPNADGSCYLEWGYNKVLAAVYGPREAMPKHTASPYRANINYFYRMASFSVPDRKNPRPGRREVEINRLAFLRSPTGRVLSEGFRVCAERGNPRFL